MTPHPGLSNPFNTSDSLLYSSMQVTEVNYLSNYTLYIKFEDGVEGAVNLSDLVEKGVFQTLKQPSVFSTAYSTGASVAWSDDLEIDSDYLYLEITGKTVVPR